MSSLTYGESYVPTAAKAASPRKGWFTRFVDHVVEVRMQQAAREVELHLGYLPHEFGRRGERVVKTDRKDLPLGR